MPEYSPHMSLLIALAALVALAYVVLSLINQYRIIHLLENPVAPPPSP